MSDCKWTWKDKTERVLICLVHQNKHQFVKPREKDSVVTLLKEAGEWAGADTEVPPLETTKPLIESPTKPTRALTPSVEQPRDLIEYESFAGAPISLTIQAFQSLLCREANAQQAQFMMAWCQHNRIDPYANEAHFSIMDSKPVIQVSKDAWFKRMEAHPDFVSQDSGILVRVPITNLRLIALMENEDYLLNPTTKKMLLDDPSKLPWKSSDNFPNTLTVKKRGQFVDEGEELLGGWASITKKSRPQPIVFQIPVKGWELRKGDGSPNIFWQQKAPFMIWKSALKNGCRLAFPDLSGLLAVPEFAGDDQEEDGQLREVSMVEPTEEEQRKALLRTLHAAGADVPPPYGPFNHLDLHNLAIAMYEPAVTSLADLDSARLSELIATVTSAQTDGGVAHDLVQTMNTSGQRQSGLSLKRTRTSDEMGG